MAGLAWTAVFAWRWNAMMILTMMKVRMKHFRFSRASSYSVQNFFWK
jgi:hypothetical protein